jgi:hypothetical protein
LLAACPVVVGVVVGMTGSELKVLIPAQVSAPLLCATAESTARPVTAPVDPFTLDTAPPPPEAVARPLATIQPPEKPSSVRTSCRVEMVSEAPLSMVSDPAGFTVTALVEACATSLTASTAPAVAAGSVTTRAPDAVDTRTRSPLAAV